MKKQELMRILRVLSNPKDWYVISEAQYPQSLADILSKFKIARKERIETESRLKLLCSSGATDEETLKKYRNLCGRI